MMFRQIEFGSAEYRRQLALREEVLRKPLGLEFREEDLEREREHWHFGLFDADGSLVGGAVVERVDAHTVKIRQVVIASEKQRCGHGRRIMCELEARFVAEDVRHFVLHARLYAAGFYERLGYHSLGEPFTEVTIPHVAMEKHLPAAQAPGTPSGGETGV